MTRLRQESGQALVMVMVALALMVLITPVLVRTVSNDTSTVSQEIAEQAALAAAEAGIQQYRNYLDVYTNYWRFSASDNPNADTALSGWDLIPSTSPAEAFHYVPNAAALTNPGASSTDEVVLTVTGRASDGGGGYVYQTVQTSLQNSGVLSDAYFSQYEVLDQYQNTTPVSLVTWTVPKTGSKTSTPVNPEPTMQTAPPMTPNQSFWSSLCQYETFQPNSFIDSLPTGQQLANPYVSGQNYSATYPYYGPFRGNEPNNSSNNNTLTYTYPTQPGQNGSQTYQVATVTDPCGTPFNFVGGESFTGLVYSNDQLWVCGSSGSSPVFSGGLLSGIPKGFQYGYKQWPTQNGSNSGTNGWIDSGALGSSGWDDDCGVNSQAAPSFGSAKAPQQGGTENLPPVDNYLATVAKTSGSYGCSYTGPTMIYFAQGGYFYVWSPLSGNLGSTCGNFTASLPSDPGFVGPLTVPSEGLVIYVNNAPQTATIPALAQYEKSGSTPGALPTGATCLDPWKPYQPANGSQPCTDAYNGDVIVGGELEGEVTIGAANNIVISRYLTYQCADQSDTFSQQQSAAFTLPSSCITETNPDVLGLMANQDIVLGHPGLVTSTLPPTGSSDDNTPSQTEPYEWPAVETVSGTQTSAFCPTSAAANGGTPTSGSIASFIVPDCEVENPIVDAAVVTTQGSFADEDWDMGINSGSNGSGGVYLQGTDASYTRGAFGCRPCSGGGDYGYLKNFVYDTRLYYLIPPAMIAATNAEWNPQSFVSCGGISTDTPSTMLGPNDNVCPGLNSLDP